MTSSLDPDIRTRRDRQTDKGHGTAELGPSDTSDSGSDIVGCAGLAGEIGIGLDSSATFDSDAGDTDVSASAGRDNPLGDAEDIDIDQIESIAPEEFEHDEIDVDPETLRAKPDTSEHPQARPRH